MSSIAPIHPGTVLETEFLTPLAVSPTALAQALGVPARVLTAVLEARAPMTAELALRLARHLGTTPEFWLNLQQAYDLAITQDALGERIAAEVPPHSSR